KSVSRTFRNVAISVLLIRAYLSKMPITNLYFQLIMTPMSSSPLPREAEPHNFRIDPQHPYLRIHAVNIFVRDQERSLTFYLDQLGFELAFDARLQSGRRWVAVSPPDGTAVLTLIAPDPDSREYNLIGRPTEVVFVTED